MLATTGAPYRNSCSKQNGNEYLMGVLQSFSDAVWKKPTALRRTVERGSSHIEYIELGEHFDAVKFLCSLLQYSKILVREEYRLAKEALQSNVYESGASVTGQPGIGKTYFLVYLLVECLRNGHSVAFQMTNGDASYVLFSGTKVAIHPNGDSIAMWDAKPRLALSDSGPIALSPPGGFQGIPDVRIIHACSPAAKRWKDWSKQYDVKHYIMDIWSNEEIGDLAWLLGLDVGHTIALAIKYGGVPRTLLRTLSRNSESELESDILTSASRVLPFCFHAIIKLKSLDAGEASGPLTIFSIGPAENDAGVVNRTESRVYVPTAFIRDALAMALQEKDKATKIAFFNAMEGNAGTRGCGHHIYENWYHSLLVSGEVLHCKWHGTSMAAWLKWLPHTLRTPTRLVSSQDSHTLRDDRVAQAEPFHFIAAPFMPSSNMCSALVTKREIIVIQIVFVSDDSGTMSPQKSLDDLQMLFPQNITRGRRWSVLFIGMEERTAQVSAKWANKLVIDSEGRRGVPVGWCALDPSDPWVGNVKYIGSVIDKIRKLDTGR